MGQGGPPIRHHGRGPVQLAPPSRGQGVVHRPPVEGVGERHHGHAGPLVRIHQARGLGLFERPGRIGHLGHLGHHGQAGRLAEHSQSGQQRCGPGLGPGQAIGHHRSQVAWHGQVPARSGQHLDRDVVEQGGHVQGVAPGVFGQPPGRGGVQLEPSRRGHRGDVVGLEAAHLDALASIPVLAQTGPAVVDPGVVGASGAHHHHRFVLEAPGGAGQGLARGRIDPVEVLDHHHQRAGLAELGQPGQHQAGRLHHPRVERDLDQIRQRGEGDALGHLVAAQDQHGAVGQDVAQRVAHQGRFAGPRFAFHRHHSGLARAGPLHRRSDPGQLLVPTHQRGLHVVRPLPQPGQNGIGPAGRASPAAMPPPGQGLRPGVHP